jgi:hypothetical protein
VPPQGREERVEAAVLPCGGMGSNKKSKWLVFDNKVYMMDKCLIF